MKKKVFLPWVAVVWNLLLVYLVYQMVRVEYLLENSSYLNYTTDTFLGGLLFDTSAILYTNVLYVLLLLLPLHWKENTRYQCCCKWLFMVVNGIATAVNLADSVYFQYTMRRTTTSVFSEFSNEGNLGSIIGTELLRHWYLVLLFVIIVFILWKLYITPRTDGRHLRPLWRYYTMQIVALLVFTPLCIAGMRGGFTTAVRPITISNANQYAARPTDAALVLNTPFALIRTVGKDVFTVPHYFDDKELEDIYTPLHAGKFKDSGFSKKNVVVLIVESFGVSISVH